MYMYPRVRLAGPVTGGVAHLMEDPPVKGPASRTPGRLAVLPRWSSHVMHKAPGSPTVTRERSGGVSSGSVRPWVRLAGPLLATRTLSPP